MARRAVVAGTMVMCLGVACIAAFHPVRAQHFTNTALARQENRVGRGRGGSRKKIMFPDTVVAHRQETQRRVELTSLSQAIKLLTNDGV